MSYKILLADDSVTVQKIITLTFSDEGVDVVTVSNGEEAINQLSQARPALVMADVAVPGKNGYDICEFVKNHPDMKDTPVILLVPAFEPFDEERASRVGADQYLTKPFQSIRTLISTVKALLGPSVQRRITDLREETVLASALTSPPQTAVVNPQLTAALDQPHGEDETGPPITATSAPADDLREFELALGASGSVPDAPEIFPARAQADAALVSPSAAANDEDVLDLNDVLPHTWATPIPAGHADAFATTSAETHHLALIAADAEAKQTALTSALANSAQTVPQTIIDEIVERVTAQLSAHLSEELAEKLSGNLARRLAPVVAELVKEPQFRSRPAHREADSLLDLGEF